MAKVFSIPAVRFVFEDWEDLQSVVGDGFHIGEPTRENTRIRVGYSAPEGDFWAYSDPLELETALYQVAVEEGAFFVEENNVYIEWDQMPTSKTQTCLINELGFKPDDFIRNPDKVVVGS